MELMHFSTWCGTKTFEAKQSDLGFEGISMGQGWAHFQHNEHPLRKIQLAIGLSLTFAILKHYRKNQEEGSGVPLLSFS